MLSFSLLRPIDRPWLAALGLLGACGPEPVAMNGTGTTSGDATTGDAKCERIHDVPMTSSPEVLAAGELDGDEGAELVVGSRDGPLVMVFRAL